MKHLTWRISASAALVVLTVAALAAGSITFLHRQPAMAARPAHGVTQITDRAGAMLAEVRPPAGRADVRSTGDAAFVRSVDQELVRLGFHPGDDRVIVTTTLDAGLQQLAQQALADALQRESFWDPGGHLGGALISIAPGTGQVEAMTGSPDWDDAPVDVGTSLEPFVYAKALQDGKITMATAIQDSGSLAIDQGQGRPAYTVRNFDLHSHGVLAARVAFANGLSVPAARVELAAGVPATVDFLRRLGMLPRAPNASGALSPGAPDTMYGPALAFGGYPITLLEEAGATAALADLGGYHPPETVLRVTDGAGHVLYQADPGRTARQVLDPGAAYIVAQALSDDSNRELIYGRGSPLHLAGRQAAAAAGTSVDFGSADAVGFTPDLATAVWLGDVSAPQRHLLGSDGVFVAAPAWNRFMSQALANAPAARWYTPPADVVQQGGGSFLLGTPRIATLP